MEDCIFCKIVKGKAPAKKVYEDDQVFAFYSKSPVAPVHILVIPKKHIASLGSARVADEKVLGDCQVVAVKVARMKGIEGSFRLLTASGKGAGQTVSHLHYHVVGGWKGKVPSLKKQASAHGLRK